LLEVRQSSVVVFKGDTMMECRRAGYVFEAVPEAPLPAAVEISDREDEEIAPGLSSFEPREESEVVTVDLEPATPSKPRATRHARDEWERARFGFWATAHEYGVTVKGKLETKAQKDARLACLAAWCNVPSVDSLNDLEPEQIRSVTAAMRRGEILPGWQVRELAA
jgi:hypothetical protein